MKIFLAQINTTVGALEANAEKVRTWMGRARDAGADLVVFPELTLAGYPPKDLLEFPWFARRNRTVLESLAESTHGIAALVGFVSERKSAEGKGLRNSAAFLADGEIKSIHHKTLLPTYDVFDEGRHFDPAPSVEPVEFGGKRLGISICEDIWNDQLYWRRRMYARDPIETLVEQGIDVLINLSASPFAVDKRTIRRGMFSRLTQAHGIPLVYVNLVGGNDSIIFDGWSNVFDAGGNLVAQLADFEEDGVLIDIDNPNGPMRETAVSDEQQVFGALVLGIRDYLAKTGFGRAAIGLSGGIDSTVVAVLATRALGAENVLGVSMPSPYSSEGSISDARKLAQNLGIEFRVVPIERIYATTLETLPELVGGNDPDMASENVQARIRGMILMALSNKHGHLVLATGNKSEMATGYCTLYGDMVGGLAVIGDVPKTLVYRIAEYVNESEGREVIPRSVIEKAPSAELAPGQKDTDALPPYEILDPIVTAYVEERLEPEAIVEKGFERAVVEDVVRRINQNEYKRMQAAMVLKVTSKAFGYGRRMPVAAKY